MHAPRACIKCRCEYAPQLLFFPRLRIQHGPHIHDRVERRVWESRTAPSGSVPVPQSTGLCRARPGVRISLERLPRGHARAAPELYDITNGFNNEVNRQYEIRVGGNSAPAIEFLLGHAVAHDVIAFDDTRCVATWADQSSSPASWRRDGVAAGGHASPALVRGYPGRPRL